MQALPARRTRMDRALSSSCRRPILCVLSMDCSTEGEQRQYLISDHQGAHPESAWAPHHGPTHGSTGTLIAGRRSGPRWPPGGAREGRPVAGSTGEFRAARRSWSCAAGRPHRSSFHRPQRSPMTSPRCLAEVLLLRSGSPSGASRTPPGGAAHPGWGIVPEQEFPPRTWPGSSRASRRASSVGRGRCARW